MYRLADAHRISSKALIKNALFNQLIAQSTVWKGYRTWQLKDISYYLTPGKTTEGLIAVLIEATGIGGLTNCTMLPMRQLIGTRDLFSCEEQHCPLCLKELSKAGKLDGYLIWELACVTACPVHMVKLEPSKCGAPTYRGLKLFSRKNLSGVCSTCGSIGYQCREETPSRASDVAVWKAMQVAELISCFPVVNEFFSQHNLMEGLSALISLIGGGKPAVAARIAGLNKSVLWEWLHGSNHPSLGLLLDLCLAARVSLVSVMKGRLVECISPLPEVKTPHSHTQKPTGEVRKNALEQALSTDPPKSLSAIATSLGFSRKSLCNNFPELSRRVAERYRQYTLYQYVESDKKARRIVQNEINEMTAEDLPLTLRNFQAAIGKALLPESRLRQLFKEALVAQE